MSHKTNRDRDLTSMIKICLDYCIAKIPTKKKFQRIRIATIMQLYNNALLCNARLPIKGDETKSKIANKRTSEDYRYSGI